ncbi:hypothetical protein JAAARDRAFT_373840 [Jaapia argillacea MUCL 33604]|uniref:Uncharacterized protein n=1 Tax=Jaapia argillacea MUCL 33604 TaxID=933084 RepID=A0A067Q8I9_9AGAM|nr:hypothetical protein JAAARDRAFT_373840 [Jaapia argillacea MUCL 33604]
MTIVPPRRHRIEWYPQFANSPGSRFLICAFSDRQCSSPDCRIAGRCRLSLHTPFRRYLCFLQLLGRTFAQVGLLGSALAHCLPDRRDGSPRHVFSWEPAPLPANIPPLAFSSLKMNAGASSHIVVVVTPLRPPAVTAVGVRERATIREECQCGTQIAQAAASGR